MSSSKELRQKFLEFFEKKGHQIVPSSSLIPDDPTVLFTSAGMQQFKPYYLGEKSPYGRNVCSCQKCFRTSDIEEVGDKSHLTFLEMLGNFSFSRATAKAKRSSFSSLPSFRKRDLAGEDEDLSSSPGGYFKEEAIKLAFEFLFKELKLSLRDAIFTVFEGDRNVPADEDSVLFWEKLGIPESKIKKLGREDNFWGPTGNEGPCGPTTEIHLKGVELWNLVFNEYYQDRKGNLTPLKQKGVDTGMGLERLAMICQDKSSIYETDLFLPIIKKIPGQSEKARRIIADHTKGAVFLISEGILPSNVGMGYILRRILRRAIRFGKILNLPENFLVPLSQKTIEVYKDIYPELKSRETEIITAIQNEEEKFGKTLEKGLKELNKLFPIGKIKRIKPGQEPKAFNRVDAEKAFYIYQTYGFPLEMIQEELARRALLVDEEEFNKELKRHQEISRAGVEKKFGGTGKKADYETTKLHTATHLLHQALREILGFHVKQMGSDITSKRLRFDFSHPQKMTSEEIKKVENLVNQKIKEDLKVKKEEMPLKEALASGALALVKEDKSSFPPSSSLRGKSVFKEKYPEKVTVYTINDFSKEICAGPHVKRTSELGNFKIIKEESSGAGIRRIRAILE